MDNPPRTYLLIGAHPDDTEISAGLLAIEALKQGHSVFAVTLTHGDKSNEDVRMQEWEEAIRRMGYSGTYSYKFPDTKLKDHEEMARTELEELRERLQPDYVIFHTENDRHQDHQSVSRIASIAFRGIDNLYKMHSPSTRSSFTPQIHAATTDPMSAFKKAHALGAYESQRRITHPVSALSRLASVGREAKTHQDLQSIEEMAESAILEDLVAWDPLSIGNIKGSLRERYLGILAAYPIGTVYSEGFEANHITHRF